MTKLVAILNITPDSFSDGGTHFRPDAAVEAMSRFIREGADVIDIGAESTRPGATPLSPEEEWQRLEPALGALPPSITISVDTRHAQTARRALALGVHWINDVSGFVNPAMVQAVKNSICKVVIMHSLTVPADKNVVIPESANVIDELIDFANARIMSLEAAGIARERIIFDPGIGFGKTPAQSWDIVSSVAQLYPIGVPILIGHSRKSFLHNLPLSGGGDVATLAVSKALSVQGVDYLRVHNVAAHRRLLDGVHE